MSLIASDPNATYEPTEADIQWLNRLDAGYVGVEKPKTNLVIDSTDEDDYYLPPWELERRYGDRTPVDYQGYS